MVDLKSITWNINGVNAPQKRKKCYLKKIQTRYNFPTQKRKIYLIYANLNEETTEAATTKKWSCFMYKFPTKTRTGTV